MAGQQAPPGGVHVHVAQHSAAVDAALQGHVPEIEVRTPHTSLAAKGVFGVAAVAVVAAIVAVIAHLPGRTAGAVQVPHPAPPAMSQAEVRVLAGEVAEQTAERVERLMDAKLGAVRVEVQGLRAGLDRLEQGQAVLRRGR